jgi:hypothetical protein
LKISNRFGKDAKNNRLDSKHGTFRKYSQPPIDTSEETSAIPLKKMKPKNEALDSFDVLKKGELITVEGYFKPEEWTDSKSGEKRNRIVMVATKFYPAPEKEEEKPDRPKKKAASKKKKASK